jgi:hypothetical protein
VPRRRSACAEWHHPCVAVGVSLARLPRLSTALALPSTIAGTHGRSCGGRTTKIHAVCGALGRTIVIEVTPGQLRDVRAVPPAFSVSCRPIRQARTKLPLSRRLGRYHHLVDLIESAA